MSSLPPEMLQTMREAMNDTLPLLATTIRRAKVPNGRGGRITSEQIIEEKVAARLTPMAAPAEKMEGTSRTKLHWKLTLDATSIPLYIGDGVQIDDAEYTVDVVREMGEVQAARRYEVSLYEGDYRQIAAPLPDEGD